MRVNINQHKLSSNNKETLKIIGVNFDDFVFTSEQKNEINRLFHNWQHVFSIGPTDLGHVDIIGHEIHLSDDRPFKKPHRHIPPGMIKEHLKEIIECGAIRGDSPDSPN